MHLYVFLYIYLCVGWNNSVCLCGTQIGSLDGVRLQVTTTTILYTPRLPDVTHVINLPILPPPVFAHTASDQKLEVGTHLERGYLFPISFDLLVAKIGVLPRDQLPRGQLPRGQFPPDQLPTRSIPTKSTQCNTKFIMLKAHTNILSLSPV